MGEVKQINIKNRTDYFYNDMINLKNFEPDLLKIDGKSYKNIKELMIMKIFTVQILCICVIKMQTDILKKKNENEYLIFDTTYENKELLKNIKMFEMELKTKSKQ